RRSGANPSTAHAARGHGGGTGAGGAARASRRRRGRGDSRTRRRRRAPARRAAELRVRGRRRAGREVARRRPAGRRDRPRRPHVARLPHADGRRRRRGRRSDRRASLVSEPSVETQMWTLVRGAMATKALGLVADHGIADKLADGPRPVAELAAETGVDEDALYRFLRALASDGVFAEEPVRTFANTPMSQLLLSDRADSWRDVAHLFGDLWYRTFLDAEDSLSSGEPAFPATFG